MVDSVCKLLLVNLLENSNIPEIIGKGVDYWITYAYGTDNGYPIIHWLSVGYPIIRWLSILCPTLWGATCKINCLGLSSMIPHLELISYGSPHSEYFVDLSVWNPLTILLSLNN